MSKAEAKSAQETRQPTRLKYSWFFSLILLVLLIAILDGDGRVGVAGIAVRSGEKIAFLGDSITQYGWDQRSGYVRLVMLGLKVNGINAVAIPAGVSGNMSNNELGRLQHDVLSKKPDWMLVSCGVNDVWHTPGGVPLGDYKRNMTQIVSRAQIAGIKVMILTATMIGEDSSSAFNQKLIAYNAFLRRLAVQKHCLLADVGADMQARIRRAIVAGSQPGCLLTVDGVHPNPSGNIMMAGDILKTFGFDGAQQSKARLAWLKVRWNLTVTYQVRVNKQITLGQFLQLQRRGSKKTSAAIWDQVQDWFQTKLDGMTDVKQFDHEVQSRFDQYIDALLAQKRQ